MNRIALLTLALAAAAASTAALADGHAPGKSREHMRGQHHGHDITRLDTNQDGRIARAELAGEGRGVAALAQRFDAIDANKDGYLVRTELQAWRQARGAERRGQRAQRHAERFAEADLNKDGRLSKVEAGEKMPRLARHFAWMDDNRDGYLSREELQPGRGFRAR